MSYIVNEGTKGRSSERLAVFLNYLFPKAIGFVYILEGIDITDRKFYYVGQTTNIVTHLTSHFSQFGNFSKKRPVKELKLCYLLPCEDYKKRKKEYIHMKIEQLEEIINNTPNKEIIEILNKVSVIRKSDKILRNQNRRSRDIVVSFKYQLSKNPFLTVDYFFNRWGIPPSKREEY